MNIHLLEEIRELKSTMNEAEQNKTLSLNHINDSVYVLAAIVEELIKNIEE